MKLAHPQGIRFFGTDEQKKRLIEPSKYTLAEVVRWTAYINFNPLMKEMGLYRAGSAATMLSFLNRLQEAYWKGENEFVSIHARSWENKLADGIRTRIKNALIAASILETDGHYIPNEKSLGYRFTDSFYHDHVIPLRDSNPSFKEIELKPRKQVPCDPTEHEALVLGAMAKNELEVMVDEKRALEILQSKSGNASETIRAIDSIRAFHLVEQLGQNLRIAKHRFFGDFVNIPSSIKSAFIHKDGKEFISLDIKACHPTLLHCLYEGETEIEREEAKKHAKWLAVDFYRKLLQVFSRTMHNTNYRPFIPTERSVVKDQFIKALNSEEFKSEKLRVSKIGGALWDFYRRQFPEQFKRLRKAIESNKDLYVANSGKICVGVGLMALELKVMLPVYLELIKRGLWFIPAHDGLTVEKAGAAIAKKLTEESLGKVVGQGVVTLETWLDKKPITL